MPHGVKSPSRQRRKGEPRANGAPASKELRALARQFKQGYKLDRTSGGHYRVRDRQGNLVVNDKGETLIVGGTPSTGGVRAFRDGLTEAKVLRGTEQRVTEAQKERRRERASEVLAVRQANRQEVASALHARLSTLLANVGGLDTPGMSADLGHVAALVGRDLGQQRTPDLYANAAYRVANGAWVDRDYQVAFGTVAERLEAAPDVVGEWFGLVREARGLPADHVEVRRPAKGEWPFDVELLPLDALFVDHDYQRPVKWAFVRREAARFDPSLVGTLDVAQRSPSSFAILDGQQRAQIVRLVGKASVWASIYRGLDKASEARFFLHKNKDRNAVHPYYTFRARVTSDEPEAIEIERIVKQFGYRLAIGAPRAERAANISAIAAIEAAYKRKQPSGDDCLAPTLATLKGSTLGRPMGQSNVLIRGLSIVYSRYDAEELREDVMTKAIAKVGPELLLGRARDLARGSGGNAESAMARTLVEEYRRAAGRNGSKIKWRSEAPPTSGWEVNR